MKQNRIKDATQEFVEEARANTERRRTARRWFWRGVLVTGAAVVVAGHLAEKKNSTEN